MSSVPSVAAQLAQAAVDFGRATRVSHLHIVTADHEISASAAGVTVIRVPRDLPMREHPAFGANRRVLLDAPIDRFADRAVEPAEPLDRIEELMRDTEAILIRGMYENGTEMHATRATATLYTTRSAPRRFLPGTKRRRAVADTRKLHLSTPQRAAA